MAGVSPDGTHVPQESFEAPCERVVRIRIHAQMPLSRLFCCHHVPDMTAVRGIGIRGRREYRMVGWVGKGRVGWAEMIGVAGFESATDTWKQKEGFRE